jgi:sugar lactone lactonase YvrE
MLKRALILTAIAAAFACGFLIATRQPSVQGQGKPGAGFAAIPGAKGGQDVFGPYDVVADWPKPLSQLPGHENWTWGAVEGIFAENPNHVFIVQRGELPALKRPPNNPLPQAGPSLSFPTGEAPFRNASQGPVASLPGGGAPGDLAEDAEKNWKGKVGVDARWEHCLVVVDANGNIIEQWTQWDSMFKRPHAVFINPYDPEKHVWVVDDFAHAIFKFTHDGKQLVQTLGTPGQHGADATHFNRPTFLAWLPDSTLFVSDGYNGTRVAKFDKDGRFLLTWGEKGNPPNETRPGYFNTVHGIAVDPQTRRVFVIDRSNRRIQVFDENGKFLDQWSTGSLSNPQFLFMSADRNLWMPDDRSWKIVKYDLEGHLLYAWGTQGDAAGGNWNVHGLSVDQEQNLYIAEVGNGRAQKFRPRPGANPAFVAGKPLYAAWK